MFFKNFQNYFHSLKNAISCRFTFSFEVILVSKYKISNYKIGNKVCFLLSEKEINFFYISKCVYLALKYN